MIHTFQLLQLQDIGPTKRSRAYAIVDQWKFCYQRNLTQSFHDLFEIKIPGVNRRQAIDPLNYQELKFSAMALALIALGVEMKWKENMHLPTLPVGKRESHAEFLREMCGFDGFASNLSRQRPYHVGIDWMNYEWQMPLNVMAELLMVALRGHYPATLYWDDQKRSLIRKP